MNREHHRCFLSWKIEFFGYNVNLGVFKMVPASV